MSPFASHPAAWEGSARRLLAEQEAMWGNCSRQKRSQPRGFEGSRARIPLTVTFVVLPFCVEDDHLVDRLAPISKRAAKLEELNLEPLCDALALKRLADSEEDHFESPGAASAPRGGGGCASDQVEDAYSNDAVVALGEQPDADVVQTATTCSQIASEARGGADGMCGPARQHEAQEVRVAFAVQCQELHPREVCGEIAPREASTFDGAHWKQSWLLTSGLLTHRNGLTKVCRPLILQMTCGGERNAHAKLAFAQARQGRAVTSGGGR